MYLFIRRQFCVHDYLCIYLHKMLGRHQSYSQMSGDKEFGWYLQCPWDAHHTPCCQDARWSMWPNYLYYQNQIQPSTFLCLCMVFYQLLNTRRPVHMESRSCYDEWKKNGAPMQHTAHRNLVGQDHVEQKHNHATKNWLLEYVHKTSPVFQTGHLVHNEW